MTESHPTEKPEAEPGTDTPGSGRGNDDSPGELVATRHDERAAFAYAPAPEARAIVHLKSSYGLFIDGAFVEPIEGNAYKTENPATEEVLAEVAAAGLQDIDRAVEAAGRAQREVWGPMSG